MQDTDQTRYKHFYTSTGLLLALVFLASSLNNKQDMIVSISAVNATPWPIAAYHECDAQLAMPTKLLIYRNLYCSKVYFFTLAW